MYIISKTNLYANRALKLFVASREENCTNKSTCKRKTERFVQYLTGKDTKVLLAFLDLVEYYEKAKKAQLAN